MRLIVTLLTFIILSSIHSTYLVQTIYASTIKVAVLMIPKQRAIYHNLFREFTAQTGIKVMPLGFTDSDYKKRITEWMIKGKNTPDVLYWQASQRLFYFAKKGLLHPITKVWKKGGFDKNFSHVKSGVTYKGQIYGMPFSYYHWGVFYKKSLIKEHGGVPKTWNQFIKISSSLKHSGITPIAIGTKNHWPAVAWFDYINLRTNGLKFHQKVLNGKVPFKDKRIINVFKKWKVLIDKGFFYKNNSKKTWDEVLPAFYRDKQAFLLIGNFATAKFPKQIVDDIGFIPFPKINNIPTFEEAPMDLFMIAKNSKNIKEAEIFIKYMASAKVQSKHNTAIGYLAPNKSAKIGDRRFIIAGSKLLQKAKGVSQYFDRDTLPAFEKIAVPLMSGFINNPNINEITIKLEKAREQVFK